MFKKIAAVLLFIILITVSLSAQSRFALVIGNNNYSGLSTLKNPVNDAVDIADTLENLGFKVELVKNGNLGAMERAVINLKNKLSVSKDSIGFFYYAGHGVQSGGQNYLIPSGANIADEAFLKTKSLSTQVVMDLLQGAGNNLNMVILDACRDNPFSWSRSGSRGLSVVGSQPPGSIIVYATSAGSTAKDGTGRNGLFTTELLKHLKTPGIDVTEVFRLTGAGVRDTSGGSQIPAVYNQYFDKINLAGAGSAAVRTPGFQEEAAKYGSVKVSVVEAGTVYIDGVRMGNISANRSATLSDITTGTHQLEIRYGSKIERKSVTVYEGRIATSSFSWEESGTMAMANRDSSGSEGFSWSPSSSNDGVTTYVEVDWDISKFLGEFTYKYTISFRMTGDYLYLDGKRYHRQDLGPAWDKIKVAVASYEISAKLTSISHGMLGSGTLTMWNSDVSLLLSRTFGVSDNMLKDNYKNSIYNLQLGEFEITKLKFLGLSDVRLYLR
jgi:Caspase domain